ncbi:aminopeptidase n [Lasius niger]|uniref:Aminopeptidase n=1 Tax=Lasius niger TaxID=67767 RepID=A0A0J7KLZ0_LASNI|nr:aminopeptidase n [Lasius niger]
MLTMRYLLPLMLVLATCWAGNPIFDSVAPELIQEVPDDYRLPKNVVPKNYVIELTPYINTGDEKNFTFDGKSEIYLQVKENNTTTITFHAKNITLHSVNLTYEKPEPQIKEDTFLNFKEDKYKDFITVSLSNPIDTGTKNVKLSLSYTGVLNDELRGFYRSSYKKGNETRWLATTHFEPVGARQAFPCWDEPAIKATFNIRITIPENIKNYKVVSNMLESPESTNKTTVFQQTPIMSTYLVAFVVSDYEVKRENAEEKRFGVWTRPDAINSTEFALKIGNETLKKLDEFTGIKYYNMTEATKMDQISIPDFAAGAMENWGLVTYRETALLYTENKTTTQEKQAIATVIAHEFSHQWFGNLVTCDWWDYIWLNEGFATFFQYYTTEQVVQSLYDESWHLMDQFVIKILQESAFVVDATDETRPLNSKNSAKTPGQIQSLFDDIAYKKGASILRMLQQFLTEDVFQKGLQRYLSNNKFKSVTPFELFKAIQDAEVDKVKNALPKEVSLDTVMSNWLNEPGYPVVNVMRIKESEIFNLTQKRFFLTKPTKQAYTKPIEWYIPITYVTNEAPEDTKSLWMKPNTTQTIDKVNDKTWILVNKDQTGYYRVNYDPGNWKLLATYLREDYYKNISDTNRAQLIDDALNLARTGYLKYDASLRIIQYLSKETDYIPWYAAVRAFNYIDNLLQGSENLDKYHAYVARKIEAFAEEVKYNEPNEGTHVTKLGKKLALITACKYGQKDCENFAKKELEEWLEDKEGNKKLSPDLKREIICAGLRKADAETWNKAVEKYKKSNDVDERLDILLGLGCATSKEIIKNFLDLTIKEDPFTDTLSALDSIFEGNAGSFDSILDFINEHIEITKKANKKQLTALFNKLATRVITIEKYGELSLLADLHKIGRFTTFGHVIENLAWIKSYQKDVGTWFVENQNDDSSSASSFTLASFLVLIPVLLARFN